MSFAAFWRRLALQKLSQLISSNFALGDIDHLLGIIQKCVRQNMHGFYFRKEINESRGSYTFL